MGKLNELMTAFERYNENYEKKLCWWTDIIDNLEDREDTEEISRMISELNSII